MLLQYSMLFKPPPDVPQVAVAVGQCAVHRRLGSEGTFGFALPLLKIMAPGRPHRRKFTHCCGRAGLALWMFELFFPRVPLVSNGPPALAANFMTCDRKRRCKAAMSQQLKAWWFTQTAARLQQGDRQRKIFHAL